MGPRIVIIGANGQLGTDLMKALAGYDPVGLTHSDIDITLSRSVKDVLGLHKPLVVINTAAFNGVDECEFHPEKGFLVNAIGTYNLAEACREMGGVFVHFSTDYVFDGDKADPYVESDNPSPINAYGISKLAGEQFVKYLLDRYFIIRTSGLYGKAGCRGKGGNFVESMLRLAGDGQPIKVVNDQTVTPTYTVDLANQVKQVLLHGKCGIYHITNQGSCTWYQFAQRIFEITGITADLTPTTTREYRPAARRPSQSVLRNRGLQEMGLDGMRSWEEALRAYLRERDP